MSQTPNPLLEGLKLPGRVFQLPSRGLFYRNGELADNISNGEIHVRPMSALDEINMKNPDQLFSGAAINTVFSRCVDGVLKPSELLSKDVDAIMMMLRTVTYGPSYEFVAKHTCAEAKDHNYTSNIDNLINAMKLLDPTTINSVYSVDVVVADRTYNVRLRPNKYQQVIDLIRENENKQEVTVEDQQKNLVMLLLGVIESVNGLNDREMIKEWISAIPTTAVGKIAAKLENVNSWGSDLLAPLVCRDCGEKFSVEIPINPVSFFTE